MSKRPTCHYCGIPYSDWFITERGNRYCYPCYVKAEKRALMRRHDGLSFTMPDIEQFRERKPRNAEERRKRKWLRQGGSG